MKFTPWLLAAGVPLIGATAFVVWGGIVLMARQVLGNPAPLFSEAQSGAAFGWLEQVFIGMIAATLSFGWIAGNALEHAYREESAYLGGVRSALSGLPADEAGMLDRAIGAYAADVVTFETDGKTSGAAAASLDLVVAICRDIVERGVGSPQTRSTLDTLSRLLHASRQARLSAIDRYALPLPPGLVIAPLGLALLLGATIRTSTHISDAVFNGLHASGIAIAATVALVMVLPTTTVAIPASLTGLAVFPPGADAGIR
ncbi:hypothetical protein [Skermanella stibiiresistens]|uniref:hypothetical protein n=1 Tax=Skermanella stibiiresistens TaxID=913326 RepID=UPI0018DDA389|nr:hypothetical protein [Skermanella stibiiresistens]